MTKKYKIFALALPLFLTPFLALAFTQTISVSPSSAPVSTINSASAIFTCVEVQDNCRIGIFDPAGTLLIWSAPVSTTDSPKTMAQLNGGVDFSFTDGTGYTALIYNFSGSPDGGTAVHTNCATLSSCHSYYDSYLIIGTSNFDVVEAGGGGSATSTDMMNDIFLSWTSVLSPDFIYKFFALFLIFAIAYPIVQSWM